MMEKQLVRVFVLVGKKMHSHMGRPVISCFKYLLLVSSQVISVSTFLINMILAIGTA